MIFCGALYVMFEGGDASQRCPKFQLLSAFIDELENVFEPPGSDPVA